MSEPAPLPPLPKPFAPQPRELRSREGCGRAALVGCGALVLLFGIGAVALSLKAGEIMVWLLAQLETKIVANLPADLPAGDRERLERAFDDLYAAVEREAIDPTAMQALQRQLMTLAGDVEGGLSQEQVRELTLAVEQAAAGRPAAGEDPEPSPPAP